MNALLRYLALGLALAAAPTLSLAAADPLAPCRALRADVLAKAKPADRFVRRLHDPVRDLLAPRLVLRPNVRPPASEAEVRRVTGLESSVITYQTVAPHVGRAAAVEGTANCQYDVFVRVGRNGRLTRLPAPPAFSDLCWRSTRDMATVAGRPALVQVDDFERPIPGLDVSITPWNEGWGPACRLSLRYTDAFRLDERFCGDDAVCAAAAPLAAGLARSFSRRGPREPLATPGIAPPDAAEATRLEPLRKQLASVADGELPTFGHKPKTEFPQYGGDPLAAVGRLAGRPVIVRVGVGGVGWREIGDYLVAIYDPDGRPLAGFVVSQRFTGLASATVSRPKVFKDTR